MTQEDTTNAELLTLVRQAKEGDTKAFSKIYDHYFTPVYRYTAMRVPQESAEDLVADVFVKVWEKLYTYKERKKVPFGAWLFRIARNEVIDAYRTGRTWDELPEDLSDTDELNRADTSTSKLLRALCVFSSSEPSSVCVNSFLQNSRKTCNMSHFLSF